MIPFLGLILTDLTFTEDGNQTYIEECGPTPAPLLASILSRSRQGLDLRTNDDIISSYTMPDTIDVYSLPIINFGKFRLISRILSSIRSMQQSEGYDFEKREDLQEYILEKWQALDDVDLYAWSRKCECSHT